MLNKNADVEAHLLEDDGTFPNNGKLPVLVYENVLDLPKTNPARAIEDLLAQHNWGGTWRNGIFTYQHYHSTAHEALIVYQGWAKVLLGGEQGKTFRIKAGDALVLPAGVAHKNLEQSSDFAVVGGYPVGQRYDMNYGRPNERPQTDKNIAQVPLPIEDPFFGKEGALVKEWKT